VNADLRVALSLWLNAYEALRDANKTDGSLTAELRKDAATAGLAKASANLYAVADDVLESLLDDPVRPGDAPLISRGVQYRTPKPGRSRKLMEVLLRWAEAAETIESSLEPTNAAYKAFDEAETDIRRFLASCVKPKNIGV